MTTIPIETTTSQPQQSLVIERLLRNHHTIWQQIDNDEGLPQLIVQMMSSSAIALALSGAVIGISSSALQALSSAIKLPLLFLLTMTICLPTLYLFNLLLGGRMSMRQAVATLLANITVTSALGLACVPVMLFFLLSGASYTFFVLLTVSILAITGIAGVGFVIRGIVYINQQHTKSIADSLLPFWCALYGFVGTQLGWTLRPFFWHTR
jgi:hypothetical protein